MRISPITMYKLGSNGVMNYWRIQVVDFLIEMEWGAVGTDSPQEDHELVLEGLASRTREEQIQSRVTSRMNRKVDRGYTTDIEKAKLGAKNSMGFLKPMLAQRYDQVKKVDFHGAFWQYKYDGNRCLVTNENGELIAYSRNGKPIKTISDILKGIQIPEGVTIDGELYLHGTPLQEIASYVKKKSEGTDRLVYVVYDVIMDECYSVRKAFLETLILGDRARLAECFTVAVDQVPAELDRAVEAGYEGLICRPKGIPYEDDKRSKGIIKVKKFIDDEFQIVDIIPCADGWAKFILTMENGNTFDSTCHGTVEHKKHVYENAENYIGKFVTVRFAFYTNDGIPFHAVSVGFRDKEAE